MFNELTNEDLMVIDGGVSIVKDWFVGKMIDEVVNSTIGLIDKIAHTPYERTVVRQGKRYTVKYDGNPGW